MKIWIARHGQTDLNRDKRMQGLTDCPLNEKGIMQARQSRKNIGDVYFDAVYASPLERARVTGSIIGNVGLSEVIVDERLIETDFGRYEKCKYYLMGPAMTLYWMFPKVFPVPDTVETLDSMKIMRALCGYLDEAPDGLHWERAKNCEIRVYEYKGGKHTFLRSYSLEKKAKNAP